MPLQPGSRLGPSGIAAPLGAGAMGDVCRARIARLSQPLTVEVLPDAVSADANLRAGTVDRSPRSV
jgi:hypothetical protein